MITIGATRWVFFIGKYAVKIPCCYSYRTFLQGLLANEQEHVWYKAFHRYNKLCPVLFSSPFFLFIVMPKVRVMTDDDPEANNIYLDEFITIREDELKLPVEIKADSFGWLNGRLVAIDYGT